jgi:ABC-type multidrug transport system ATPase subunit
MTLAVRALRKRLGDRQVLDGLSFTLEEGVLAVLGTNGSGKTTLLRIVAGVLESDEGSVSLRGRPLRRAHRDLGYVPEAADPPPHLTVLELERLCAAVRRAPELSVELRRRLGVHDLAGQRVGSLSLGQRRRACLAAALVGDPWLLVLDEPTNGLDAAGSAMLAGVIREHVAAGRAALVATHDLAFAEEISARRVVLTRAAPTSSTG